jgi:hypothetical protein
VRLVATFHDLDVLFNQGLHYLHKHCTVTILVHSVANRSTEFCFLWSVAVVDSTNVHTTVHSQSGLSFNCSNPKHPRFPFINHTFSLLIIPWPISYLLWRGVIHFCCSLCFIMLISHKTKNVHQGISETS